jgi:hypothetical protein
MGSEYPKGGGRYSWGIRPSGGGDIPRIFVPRWRYSSTFLKILSCPPQNMSLPPTAPQIPRPGAATVYWPLNIMMMKPLRIMLKHPV